MTSVTVCLVLAGVLALLMKGRGLGPVRGDRVRAGAGFDPGRAGDPVGPGLDG